MKKVLLTAASAGALVLSLSAVAGGVSHPAPSKGDGGYIFGQAGYGFDSSTQTLDGGITRNGFAGRVGGGYHVNKYFGLEAGFAYLPRLSSSQTVITSGGQSISGTVSSYNYAFDVMAMGTLPMTQQFFAFGGAGAAYVLTHNTGTATVSGQTVSVRSDTKGYVRPKVAAGLGYNVTPKVALTVEYDHIFQVGQKFPLSFNDVLAGVQYSF